MTDPAGNLRTRSFAAWLGLIALGCVLALAAPSCRSTERAPNLGAGWRYDRSDSYRDDRWGVWHWIQGRENVQSAGEQHYELKLFGRTFVPRPEQGGPSSDVGAAGDWECFLIVVGPFGRTEAPVDPPVLELEGGSLEVTGELVATFYEPRFDFALPPDLLEACAMSGANWILRDGETQLRVLLSADDVRGFFEAMKWADQVGLYEERAAPSVQYRALPEPF